MWCEIMKLIDNIFNRHTSQRRGRERACFKQGSGRNRVGRLQRGRQGHGGARPEAGHFGLGRILILMGGVGFNWRDLGDVIV